MFFSTTTLLASLAAVSNAYVAQSQVPLGASSKLTINSTIMMNSGHAIPRLGFGVWQTYVLATMPYDGVQEANQAHSPYDQAEEVVKIAVKDGYRHVDSAIAYRNEKPSAAGLVASKVPRDELFFTSKIPPTRFGYEEAKAAIAETLEKIGDLGSHSYLRVTYTIITDMHASHRLHRPLPNPPPRLLFQSPSRHLESHGRSRRGRPNQKHRRQQLRG